MHLNISGETEILDISSSRALMDSISSRIVVVLMDNDERALHARREDCVGSNKPFKGQSHQVSTRNSDPHSANIPVFKELFPLSHTYSV